MLQAVCEHIHNYFNRNSSPINGTFAVFGGTISPIPDLKEGQRFLITGSDMNDGIYTFHASGIMNDDDTDWAGLTDEVFAGAIIGLSIPPQVIALSVEISEWAAKYADVITSPYQSESFGGYSYTRAGNSGSSAGGWQDQFRAKLDRWRRVAF